MRRIALRLSLPLLFLCCASFAKADPIVITGGTASIDQPAGAAIASFTLLAPGFNASGMGDRNSGNGLIGIRGNSRFVGGVTSNGNSWGGHFTGTLLSFTLAPFTLPDPNTAPNTFTLSVDFTMTGQLELYQFGVTTPVFSSPVAGSGLATITYARAVAGAPFIATQIVYNFSPPAATPEPSTLLLLGTGLTGIASVVRRRSRH